MVIWNEINRNTKVLTDDNICNIAIYFTCFTSGYSYPYINLMGLYPHLSPKSSWPSNLGIYPASDQ